MSRGSSPSFGTFYVNDFSQAGIAARLPGTRPVDITQASRPGSSWSWSRSRRSCSASSSATRCSSWCRWSDGRSYGSGWSLRSPRLCVGGLRPPTKKRHLGGPPSSSFPLPPRGGKKRHPPAPPSSSFLRRGGMRGSFCLAKNSSNPMANLLGFAFGETSPQTKRMSRHQALARRLNPTHKRALSHFGCAYRSVSQTRQWRVYPSSYCGM